MVKNIENIKNQVADTLELPKDIVMNIPKLTITGNIQINIENHRGIIQYESDSIRVNTNIGIYKIKGSNLVIKNITLEEIVISGNIENVDISE